MEINGIDSEIFIQYEIIRDSGLTNMFDRTKVIQIAYDMKLNELVTFIKSKESNYGDILRNFGKAKEAGII